MIGLLVEEKQGVDRERYSERSDWGFEPVDLVIMILGRVEEKTFFVLGLTFEYLSYLFLVLMLDVRKEDLGPLFCYNHL